MRRLWRPVALLLLGTLLGYWFQVARIGAHGLDGDYRAILLLSSAVPAIVVSAMTVPGVQTPCLAIAWRSIPPLTVQPMIVMAWEGTGPLDDSLRRLAQLLDEIYYSPVVLVDFEAIALPYQLLVTLLVVAARSGHQSARWIAVTSILPVAVGSVFAARAIQFAADNANAQNLVGRSLPQVSGFALAVQVVRAHALIRERRNGARTNRIEGRADLLGFVRRSAGR